MEKPIIGSQFLDLDDILPPAKKVKIKGKEYLLAGDESVAENIRFLQRLRVLDPSDPDSVEEFLQRLSRFFLDETMTPEKIAELVTTSQLPTLAKFVFSQAIEVAEDEEKKKLLGTSETTS